MKHIYLVIAIACLSANVTCQNLVPNPGFENYFQCPAAMGQISQAGPWFASSDTPDLLHACASPASNVSIPGPTGIYGFGYPRTGNGMAGILTSENVFIDSAYNYRE